LPVDQLLHVRPSPLAIDDSVFVFELRMRFDDERLEHRAVRVDLPLQLDIDFGAKPRLLRIRHDVVDVKRVAPRVEHGFAQAPLVHADDVTALGAGGVGCSRFVPVGNHHAFSPQGYSQPPRGSPPAPFRAA
jgi:hypothetical protein